MSRQATTPRAGWVDATERLVASGRLIDVRGRKFGLVTPIRFMRPPGEGKGAWECLCDCGNLAYIRGPELRDDHRYGKPSCGCIRGRDFLTKAKRRIVKLDSGCWEWAGTRIVAGYGYFYENRKVVYVHRRMYELSHGEIPDGMCVCHHCDNPPCCNPDHLFLGTVLDNARDAVSKGRMASGERHGCAVLNREAAADIFRKYYADRVPPTKLARMHGVSRGAIRGIVKRKTWRFATEGLLHLMREEPKCVNLDSP